jgi:nitroreductase
MLDQQTETWQISEADFPAAGSPAEKLRFLLGYAILAPSGHNTQPWLFRIIDDRVELYADRTRALPVVDPEDRALTISCGASLFHLHIAMKHFGFAGKVEALPSPDDPDLLARISLGDARQPSEQENSVFHATPKGSLRSS